MPTPFQRIESARRLFPFALLMKEEDLEECAFLHADRRLEPSPAVRRRPAIGAAAALPPFSPSLVYITNLTPACLHCYTCTSLVVSKLAT